MEPGFATVSVSAVMLEQIANCGFSVNSCLRKSASWLTGDIGVHRFAIHRLRESKGQRCDDVSMAQVIFPG
jgi:hypothetical protein